MLLACFVFTSCGQMYIDSETVKYDDPWNGSIWEKAYSNLVTEYRYASDYHTFRSACKLLGGDNVATNGETKEGVRISSVQKQTDDVVDIYTLALTNGSDYSFAVLNVTPSNSSLSAYHIYKTYYKGLSMSETSFVSKFSRADVYAEFTIYLSGGDYNGNTDERTYTNLCGYEYELFAPERAGYVFDGWFYDSEYGKEVQETTITVDYDTEIYALWHAYDYESVDYTAWDNLVKGAPSCITDYYTATMKEKVAALVSEAEEKRGAMTQSEVDDYVAQLYSLTRYADFIETDIPRIYISTGNDVNKETYVSASVAVADETYGGFYDANCQIRIRGNSTSTAPKLPYNIKFSGKVSPLGMVKSKKWVLLANAFDKTLMRNAIAFDLSKAFGMDYTCDYRVVEVFVNGVNQGCYMLVESIEVNSDKVNINVNNGDALLELENDPNRYEEGTPYIFTSTYGLSFVVSEPESPSSEQAIALAQLINEAEEALSSKDYDVISEKFNVDSFVNSYLVHEYLKNVDAWLTSTRIYIKDGVIYAGPVWDFDLTAGNVNRSYYSSYYDSTSGSSADGEWAIKFAWFNCLKQCKEFNEALAEKYKEMQPYITSLYSGEDNYVDRFTAAYGAVISRNYASLASGGAGWSVNVATNRYERTPDSTYAANVSFLKSWLEKRNTWMLSYLGIS